MALLLVGGAIVLAGLFMAGGLAYQANALAKALVGFLQGFGPLGNFLAGLVGGPIVALTSWISHELGVAFKKVEDLGVRWVSGLNQYVGYMAEYGLKWGEELLKTSVFLQTWFIPNLIRSALRTVEAEIVTLYKHIGVQPRILIRLPKLTMKQVRAAVAALLPGAIALDLPLLSWLRKNFHALTAVLPHTLPIPFGRTIAQIKRRLAKLEATGVGALAAVAILDLAFRRVGLSWLRCGSLRKLGKRVGCGGFGLLESFLADAFEVFLVTNLCTFIYLMQRAAEQIRPELLAFVDVENALIGCHGNEAPPDLTYKSFESPPVKNALTLAA